jgi:hypothetical protein
MERKIVVPFGMLAAAVDAMNEPSGTKFRSTKQWASIGLEAALRWMAENPIVPTDEQKIQMLNHLSPSGVDKWDHIMWEEFICASAVEWQRQMFLAPQSEGPEAIRDLLVHNDDQTLRCTIFDANERLREAYRRGIKAGRE